MTDIPVTIDEIMSIMETAFDPYYGEAWNRRQIEDALSMPHTHALLIDEVGSRLTYPSAGSAAGFAMSRHAADEEELLLLAVRPEHRGNGLGKSLIEHLFAAARSRSVARVFLEMRRDNPAESVYRTTGFEAIGVRPSYYRLANGDRIDAITFAKSI